MATRAKRDMTPEEFEDWIVARRNVEEVNEATAEEGGLRVSLVPVPTSVPVDFLPDEVTLPPLPPESVGSVTFIPQPSRKTGGWSADRQRLFIEALAETGSVHHSAKSAGLSARSAYGLRVRSPAFAAAWDSAQQLAVGRLSAMAFDRAMHGRIEQVYCDGDLVGEKRVPNDRMLMWLLSRLDPNRFATVWEQRADNRPNPQAEAQKTFPALLDNLTDVAAD
jgi:hypothetical protein